MSQLAGDLLELLRLGANKPGALIEHLLRELALNLISPGCAAVPAARCRAWPRNAFLGSDIRVEVACPTERKYAGETEWNSLEKD
ncbi:hypothetical protein [Paraburkholderia sp. MM5482-R1]|uniref:hypothetical protein n=1 Tax=unclassified Paraburkholderia TaxID=2615204 RepID=UPI003D2249E7